MKKYIFVDKRAAKEIKTFPHIVQLKTKALLEVLGSEGKLQEPLAKKLSANSLFELRINHQGQWRILYAYMKDSVIIILTAFAKKTQKTPHNELTKAQERKTNYE